MHISRTKKLVLLGLFLLAFVGASFAISNLSHAQSGCTYQSQECVNDTTGLPGICVDLEIPHGIWDCVPVADDGTVTEGLESSLAPAKDSGGILSDVGNYILNALAYAFAALAALILGISGVLLNLSVNFTILKMSTLIESVGSINIAWTLIRDVANVAFIFVILLIAISLILRVGQFNSKSLLIRVIVAALLINFSLFFTKVIIDASNIVTIALYQPLLTIDNTVRDTTTVPGGEDGGTTEEIAFYGISGAFVQELDVLGVHKFENFDKFSNVTRQIMGGVFMLIAAFVFLFAAILLVIRFVIFILLMVTSPIAWLGMFLPAMKKYASQWWDTMLNQAFFAPILMLMFTLSYLVISDNNFDVIIKGNLDTNASLGNAFQGVLASIPIVLNFVIGIGFLIASIIIAKGMASVGAGSAVKWASQKAGRATFGAAGFAGRQTFGRAGRSLSDPNTKLGGRISSLANSKNVFARTAGRTFSRGADKLQKSNFDAAGVIGASGADTGTAQKGGFKKTFEEQKKREQNYIKNAAKPSKKTQQTVATEKANLTRLARGLTDKQIRNAKDANEAKADTAKTLKETGEKLVQTTNARAAATDPGIQANLDRQITQLNDAIAEQTIDAANAENRYRSLPAMHQEYVETSNRVEGALKRLGKETKDAQIAAAERVMGSPIRSRSEAGEEVRKDASKSKEEKGTEKIIDAIRSQSGS